MIQKRQRRLNMSLATATAVKPITLSCLRSFAKTTWPGQKLLAVIVINNIGPFKSVTYVCWQKEKKIQMF